MSQGSENEGTNGHLSLQYDLRNFFTGIGMHPGDEPLSDEMLTYEMGKLQEEFDEAMAAFLNGDREQLPRELLDIAYVSLGLLELLGHDIREAWDSKHAINVTKYDPNLYEALRHEGLSHHEALDHMKATWPDRRDTLLE